MTALPQSYFFYTTGVDRVTGIFENVGTWPDRVPLFQLGFEHADALWTSLQNKRSNLFLITMDRQIFTIIYLLIMY